MLYEVITCRPSLISELREELGQGQLNTAKRFPVIACCGNALPPRLVKYADGILVRITSYNVCYTKLLRGMYGVGPDQPVASNSTEAGKAQNRRVEITLSPMGE